MCKHILCIHTSYIYIYILSISFSGMEKPSTHGPLMDAPFHFAHVIRSNFGHLKPQGHQQWLPLLSWWPFSLMFQNTPPMCVQKSMLWFFKAPFENNKSSGMPLEIRRLSKTSQKHKHTDCRQIFRWESKTFSWRFCWRCWDQLLKGRCANDTYKYYDININTELTTCGIPP